MSSFHFAETPEFTKSDTLRIARNLRGQSRAIEEKAPLVIPESAPRTAHDAKGGIHELQRELGFPFSRE